MNNWRLLLLAVVAVLQPIGSFTESNFFDGSQECCDHRSNSATQESSLYGNYRKTTTEDRRLSSQYLREDTRRHQIRGDPIVLSRERLNVERTDRRITPDSAVKFNTEARFVRDQERRQRSVHAWEFRQIREDQSHRSRESDESRESLNRYERDALESRRTRMSRDATRIVRDSARTKRDSNGYRQDSTNRDTMILNRNRNNVARHEARLDSRIDTFRFGNRVQDNNERRSLGRRLREITRDTRRSQESRENGVDLEHLQTRSRIVEKRDEIRRERDRESRESRDRTATLRDFSSRIAVDRLRESRDAVKQLDQTRKHIRENRASERITENHQHRDMSKLYRERSSELRNSRLNTERRQISRESWSDDGTETRRESTKDLLEASRESSIDHRALESARLLRIVRGDETRNDRRQLTRSLDRVSIKSSMIRSTERGTITRFSERTRDERASRNRRDVRSAERLDERREQQQESQISREAQLADLRRLRDSSERRLYIRGSVSPSRGDVLARSERESGIRGIRDNKRSVISHEREERSRDLTLNRMARDTERRYEGHLSRNSRSADRTSVERISRMREDIRTERSDVPRVADNESIRSITTQRFTRDISAPKERFDTRRNSRNFESNSRLKHARTLEDVRAERRDAREHGQSRVSRDRISIVRSSRERIENQKRENRETRDSRIDARDEITRNRHVQMERFESRNKVENRPQDRPLQRQIRDNLATESVERRTRDVSRDIEIRGERFSRSHDGRSINERDIRNSARDIRTVESRRETRMMEREVQPNRHNLALERVTNRENRKERFETKLKSSDTVSRLNTKPEIDTRFRSFEAKIREVDAVDETSENRNAMSWQMVFYTLQGAYLCGLLIQMMTEKSNKGKSRKFTWWSSASNDLVKVD